MVSIRVAMVWALLAATPVGAATQETMWLIPADEQLRVWNGFVESLRALHTRRVAEHDIVEAESLGGYQLYPDFYREVNYTDKKTGKVLSQVQWERAHPDRIHNIALYFYDAQGRRVRDYTAMYLPWARNSPIQTLISFYAYQPTLTAFRKFDASGRRVYEDCEGTFNGKAVDIELDEFDMAREHAGLMQSAMYRACFASLPQTAGKFLTPQ